MSQNLSNLTEQWPVLSYLGIADSEGYSDIAKKYTSREFRDLAIAYLQGDPLVRSASKVLPMYSLVSDKFSFEKVKAHIDALDYYQRLNVASALLDTEKSLETSRRFRYLPVSTDAKRE